MNKVSGMTIKQFNETLNVMREVYNFNDETTRLDEFMDMRTQSNRQVCIHTTDENTGVEIILCKGVDVY